MRQSAPWIAFLVILFGLVGLCGLFASVAAMIPLERSIARNAMLDEVLASAAQPDGAERLQRLRPMLGSLAAPVLDGANGMEQRVAAAREVVRSERVREEASVVYRTRLMLGVVTLLAAALGSGVLLLARRAANPG